MAGFSSITHTNRPRANHPMNNSPRPVVVLSASPPGFVALNEQGMEFDPHKAYAGCCICGRIFQSKFDRMDNPSKQTSHHALTLRTNWRKTHAKTHPPIKHQQLRLSGLAFLPEAAYNLAAFGLIDLVGLGIEEELDVGGGEVQQAYLESKPVPSDDAETD